MRRAAGIVTCARPAGIGPRSPGTGRSGPASAGRGASLRRRGSWGTAVRPWAWLCLDGSGPRGSLFSRGADGVGGPGPWWSHLDGRSVPRQPGRPKPSRMEVLDEFDSEFPQSVAFCQLISEEDFERQAVTYTERALRRLFRSIDRNPALAERVVRKGKQAECEQRGILSFLWVRAGGAGPVQGRSSALGGGGGAPPSVRLGRQVGSFRRLRLICGLPTPSSPTMVAGQILQRHPGGAELLQQHGRPGDAPAPGAAEEAHPPRAPLLPG